MAYDESLAVRIRAQLSSITEFEEMKMFGGLCFLVRGHMCAGIVGPTLMLRVGPERHRAALARPHARPMDFTGRVLKGMVYVDPPGIASGAEIAGWLRLAFEFVQTLPPKGRPSQKAQSKPPRRTRRGR